MNKTKVIKDAHYYSDLLSKSKVIGSRVIRVELCFTIVTEEKAHDFTQSQIDFLQREETHIAVKRPGDEHIVQIGFIVEPAVD